jgi:hypothetical protein
MRKLTRCHATHRMMFLNEQELNLHNPLELPQDYLAYLFNNDPTVDFGWT